MATSPLVLWNTPEGKRRLFESRYSGHFFQRAHLFERQVNPTYCGIASGVMALNALRLPKKGIRVERSLDIKTPSGEIVEYNAYTQVTFHTVLTQKVKSRDILEGNADHHFDPGLSLDQLVAKLKTHLLLPEAVHAKDVSQKSLNRFRQDLMAHLNDKHSFIIANFDSAPLGRKGSGHFSPLTAYHPETDSVLVMDVAGHKQPWFWVPVDLLYRSMHTKDGQNWRGYLVVTDKLDR